MTIEEIIRGESKNIEFKVTLPKDSEKYTKSIIAFANTQGGKLIFGVDDKTRNVTGIDDYLKAKGKDMGTFIRVAGTSRPAHPEKIKELEMEGARIYWDELTCVGYEVTEDAVKKLCCDIVKCRNEMGLPERDVAIAQLINWKLLKRENDSLMASNAFVLMTSDMVFPRQVFRCMMTCSG